MDFKILIDDRSEKDGIDEEHGLSIYIKTNGRRILFDSGCLLYTSGDKRGFGEHQGQRKRSHHDVKQTSLSLIHIYIDIDRRSVMYIIRYEGGWYLL